MADASNNSSAIDEATKGNPLGFLVNILSGIAALMTIYSLFSFLYYLYPFYDLNSLVELLRYGPEDAPWPALQAEYQMMVQNGYSLDWLGFSIIDYLRSNLYPFWQFVDLILIRIYGLLGLVVPFFVVTGAFFFYGKTKYEERRRLFKSRSATILYYALGLRFFLYSIIALYVAIPFGGFLPFIGECPISIEIFGIAIWLSNPVYFFFPVASIGSLIAFAFGMHFTTGD